jgi:hypothetical protein
MRCGYCGSQLHAVANCPKTWGGSVRHAAMRCSFCGARDHNVKACPKTWVGSASRVWREEEVKDDFVKDKLP